MGPTHAPTGEGITPAGHAESRDTTALPATGNRPTPAETTARLRVDHASDLTEALFKHLQGMPEIDQRWIAIGKTQIQLGFMALFRGIDRPHRL